MIKMSREELLGYLYGARLEALFRHGYYTNMYKKWEGAFHDKIDKLVKAYGWICEARLLSELLDSII